MKSASIPPRLCTVYYILCHLISDVNEIRAVCWQIKIGLDYEYVAHSNEVFLKPKRHKGEQQQEYTSCLLSYCRKSEICS